MFGRQSLVIGNGFRRHEGEVDVWVREAICEASLSHENSQSQSTNKIHSIHKAFATQCTTCKQYLCLVKEAQDWQDFRNLFLIFFS